MQQDPLSKAIDPMGPYQQHTPDQIHVERFPGGFVVNGWRNGEQVRAVAHNPTRLAKLVRAWSDPSAAAGRRLLGSSEER